MLYHAGPFVTAFVFRKETTYNSAYELSSSKRADGAFRLNLLIKKRRNKKNNRNNKEEIKKKILEFFEAPGNDNVKTQEYRKKFSSIMFS